MSITPWACFTDHRVIRREKREKEVLENQTTDSKGFEVRLELFSGPLDLLCHLVESRELDISEVKLSDLMAQYVQFLLNTKRVTLNERAKFFSFASRLLLSKIQSLFPAKNENESEEYYAEDDRTEEELRRMLEAFRPYRNAASWLAAAQRKRERSFVRITDEEARPFYDIGDLYGLGSLWWSLLERYKERSRKAFGEGGGFAWDEIPDAVPVEHQVGQRIDELRLQLAGKTLTLRGILSESNKKVLIVTLLALLELSRLGEVHITQSEILGEVIIDSI